MLANPDDLFGGPLLPGLNTSGDIVTPAEEQALIVAIEGTDLAPFRFQGWLGKRLTVSFGSRYDFDDRSFRSTDPMPEFLLPLREPNETAGIATGRYSIRLSAYRSATRLRCGSGGRSRAASTARGCCWNRDPFITSAVWHGMNGSIASLRWMFPGGRSPSAALRQRTLPRRDKRSALRVCLGAER
jgi:hypothetical protein